MNYNDENKEYADVIHLLKQEGSKIAPDRGHLRQVLYELPERPTLSTYPTLSEKFFAALRFAAPLGAVAALVLIVSSMDLSNDKGTLHLTPPDNTSMTALRQMDAPESVDEIVSTVAMKSAAVTESARLAQATNVQEDKELALRDKDIITNLATDYDEAF